MPRKARLSLAVLTAMVTVATTAPANAAPAPLESASPLRVAAAIPIGWSPSAPGRSAIETKVEPLAVPDARRADPTILAGETRPATSGKPGKVEVTYLVRTVNGTTTRQELERKVLVKPTPRVLYVGTGSGPKAKRLAARLAAADRLKWDRLAWCESRGIPTIVSRTGRFHGLYQFLVSTWRVMGGTGLPSQATPQEQTHRAKLLYVKMGRSPWPVCGRQL